MLVDSHCHLDYFEENEVDSVVADAAAQGVGCILSACTRVDQFPKLIKIAEKHPDVYLSVGNHPSEVLENEATVDELVKLAQHGKVVAIGETGLDYHYDFVAQEVQRDRFRAHIKAAKLSNKPVIVHMREASVDILNILREENISSGVLHCFTDTFDVAKEVLDLGFYISFAGIITFKNAESLREVAKKVPLDRILVETDSPYLAPVPVRGKTNYPANVCYVANFLAEVLNVEKTRFFQQICENFNKFAHKKLIKT